ncbi:transporter [Salipiger aestuarii]|uniref:Permease n=1 Tax=Salipiger aestuarii TaxID=568098 RepID=A0A327XVL2_9RHOB|nr:AEC family transporter [Salipiger aestuarii]KAB2538815.1 transporter [Salipiger aestuarii]RAK12362.1 hypothetical protein ATI53_104431 [Salipiger aestuarii]
MIILTIWPLFALICAGFALMRGGFPGDGFWPAAERLNYVVLFPALLVSSLVRAPLSDPALLRLGGASVATICLAAAGLVLLRLARPRPAARFGPEMQGVIRFNTYLGLAITLSLAGPEGLTRAAVLLAVAVPLVNVLSIMALSEASVLRHPMPVLRSMARNPLILACVAGLGLNMSGIGLPLGLDRFVELLARGSLPLGLLCVGAALVPAALRRELATLGLNGGLRLLMMPVLAAGVATGFALPPAETLALVIFSAIPTAPTAYVLTRQLGGDGALMAGIVTFQTLVSVATIPLVLWLLG